METFTMSRKELPRPGLIQTALAGQITNREGAGALQLSVRQFQRLKARVRLGGPLALRHGTRGRPSPRRLPPAVCAQVQALRQDRYAGFNDTHLTEKLREVHGLSISRESVRRLRRALGWPAVHRRRPPQHRARRPREAAAGQLLQLDGSPFPWLEDRGPMLTLLGAIDDATSTVLALHFRPTEDLHGYATLLHHVFRTYGLPVALYGDGVNILVRTDRHWSVSEQLAGRRAPTHLGRVLHDLGIGYVQAHSPQAKGRIERLWATLQDRLVSELRVRGVATAAAANAFVPEFLADFNRRFARPPAVARSLPPPAPPARVRAELPLPARRGPRQHRGRGAASARDPPRPSRPLLRRLSRRDPGTPRWPRGRPPRRHLDRVRAGSPRVLHPGPAQPSGRGPPPTPARWRPRGHAIPPSCRRARRHPPALCAPAPLARRPVLVRRTASPSPTQPLMTCSRCSAHDVFIDLRHPSAASRPAPRHKPVARVGALAARGEIFRLHGGNLVDRQIALGQLGLEAVEARGVAAEDGALHRAFGGTQGLEAVLLLHVLRDLQAPHRLDLPLGRAVPEGIRAPDDVIVAQALHEGTDERGREARAGDGAGGERGADLAVDVLHALLGRDVGQVARPLDAPGLLELRQRRVGLLQEVPQSAVVHDEVDLRPVLGRLAEVAHGRVLPHLRPRC